MRVRCVQARARFRGGQEAADCARLHVRPAAACARLVALSRLLLLQSCGRLPDSVVERLYVTRSGSCASSSLCCLVLVLQTCAPSSAATRSRWSTACACARWRPRTASGSRCARGASRRRGTRDSASCTTCACSTRSAPLIGLLHSRRALRGCFGPLNHVVGVHMQGIAHRLACLEICGADHALKCSIWEDDEVRVVRSFIAVCLLIIAIFVAAANGLPQQVRSAVSVRAQRLLGALSLRHVCAFVGCLSGPATLSS